MPPCARRSICGWVRSGAGAPRRLRALHVSCAAVVVERRSALGGSSLVVIWRRPVEREPIVTRRLVRLRLSACAARSLRARSGRARTPSSSSEASISRFSRTTAACTSSNLELVRAISASSNTRRLVGVESPSERASHSGTAQSQRHRARGQLAPGLEMHQRGRAVGAGVSRRAGCADRRRGGVLAGLACI